MFRIQVNPFLIVFPFPCHEDEEDDNNVKRLK